MTPLQTVWRKAAGLLILAALLFAAGAAPALAQGQTFELTQGWYEGRATYYYDFGANTQATGNGQGVATAPIYVPITGMDAEGNPQMVAGQHNIVGVVPGDEGYSDLWAVTFVTVPADYEANTFTSVQQVLDSGYELTSPGVYVNCPIVPEGSTLAEGGAPLVQGWYEGEPIYYFDFGPNPRTSAPIYAFITGLDDEGNPQFVEGQHNVIGVIPGDAGYSDFWWVNLVVVPEGYEANSITSVEEVMASGYEMRQPGLLVNCPVLRTDEATAAGAVDEGQAAAQEETAPESLPTTGGSDIRVPLLVIAGIAAVAFGLLGLAASRRQRRDAR